MKGYNFFYIPLAIIAFILVSLLANSISFSQIEKNIIFILGFLIIGIFLVLVFR